MNKYSLNKKTYLTWGLKLSLELFFLNDDTLFYNKLNKDNEDCFDWIDKNNFFIFFKYKMSIMSIFFILKQ